MKTQRHRFFPAFLLGGLTLFLAGCGGPNLLERINNMWGYGICGTAIIILDVIALVEVIGGTRSTGDKLLWSLLIVFFPVGGLLLYYFFGR